LDIFPGVVSFVKDQGYSPVLFSKDSVSADKRLGNIGEKLSIVSFPLINKVEKRNTKILCDKKGKIDLAKVIPFCLVLAMFC